MPTITSTPRGEVFAAIISERNYQDAQRGNAKSDGIEPVPMTPGGYLLAMETCLLEARLAWYRSGNIGIEPALASVRKVAALGVACMEFYGAPPRD